MNNLDLTSFNHALNDVLKDPPIIDKKWINQQAKTWPAASSFLENRSVAQIWTSTTNYSFKNLNIITVARTHRSAVSL